jgi:hypothetical protein
MTASKPKLNRNTFKWKRRTVHTNNSPPSPRPEPSLEEIELMMAKLKD